VNDVFPAGGNGSGRIKSSTRSTKFSTACRAATGLAGMLSFGRSVSISSKSESSIRMQTNLQNTQDQI